MSFISRMTYSTIEIIDCLPSSEMQTGIALYDRLRDLTPNNAPRVTRHQVSLEADLWTCFDKIEAECHVGWKPIIHIEAHAGKTGLEVESAGHCTRSVVSWDYLVDRFRAINIASEFNLGVFVAACEGIEVVRPMTIKEAAPYMFLVGANVEVSAQVVKTAAQGFYDVILTAPDLNRAFSSLPSTFTTFLAERFFANIYAGILEAQSFGKNRKERVDSLVKMILPGDAPPEQLRVVRDMAKLFAKPDRDRFETAQRVFLPRGVSFDFDELVEFARTGKIS